MIKREYWINKIESAWEKRPIIWLSGVRRVGKTSLCQSLDDVIYYDCGVPKDRESMQSPELFLKNREGKRIVLDEIHHVDDPSELLKIAADHFSGIRIIATGSSTLEAAKKFRDTLTGRKTNIYMTPLLFREAALFGNSNLDHRMLYGGLPPFFLANILPKKPFTEEYYEWVNSYWAKDIHELFNIGKRTSFIKFTELILARSGGMFEATAFCGGLRDK